MNILLQDLRYGLRRLARSPAFTAVAILSLGLGIGANTAIFSLVNTVLLRPFPVAASEQLVALHVLGKKDGVLAFSYPNYVDFRDRNQVLSGLVVTRFAPMSLSRDGNNERVWGYLVSGNYFDVLGVKAALGFAEELGIPYNHAFVRNHYIGRTFLQPTQLIRDFNVRVKLNLIAVRGRKASASSRLGIWSLWSPRSGKLLTPSAV